MSGYRQVWPGSLKVLFCLYLLTIGLTLNLPLALADTSDADNFDTLMEEPFIPPVLPESKTNSFVQSSAFQSPTQHNRLPAPPHPTQKKKWGLHFKKLGGKGKHGGGAEEGHTFKEEDLNVGPREAPASTDPLFRLPVSVMGSKGRVEPGFYLAHLQPMSSGDKELTILQKGQEVLRLTVRLEDTAPETGPAEPQKGKKLPPVAPSISVQVSEDHHFLVLTLKEGSKRYTSERIRTTIDARPQLTY